MTHTHAKLSCLNRKGNSILLCALLVTACATNLNDDDVQYATAGSNSDASFQSQECRYLQENVSDLYEKGKLSDFALSGFSLENPDLICPNESHGADIESVCSASQLTERAPRSSYTLGGLPDALLHLILTNQNFEACEDIYNDAYLQGALSRITQLEPETLERYQRIAYSETIAFMTPFRTPGFSTTTFSSNEGLSEPRHPQFESFKNDAYNKGTDFAANRHNQTLSEQDAWEEFLFAWSYENFSQKEIEKAKQAFEAGIQSWSNLFGENWREIHFGETQRKLLAAFSTVGSWNWCGGERPTSGPLAYFDRRTRRVVLNRGICTATTLYGTPTGYLTATHRGFLVAAHEFGHVIDSLAARPSDMQFLDHREARATKYGTYGAQCAARLFYRNANNYQSFLIELESLVKRLETEGRMGSFLDGLRASEDPRAENSIALLQDLSTEKKFMQCKVDYWKDMEEYMTGIRNNVNVESGYVPSAMREILPAEE